MVTNCHTILAVDDEKDMLKTFESILKKKYSVVTAGSANQALKAVQDNNIDLVLLDIRMPEMDGIKALKKIKELDQNLEVIMVTALKDVSSAVEAMKFGALDYVTKPFDVKELQALISKALEKRSLVLENLYLRESLKEATSYYDLIGSSPKMKKIYELIKQVAPTDSTVLISGESGTGKELVARAIHKASKRADKPFVAVNCAAIPDNLLESELFGHERGSFTGALERKMGKFELANEGTLFLDEIGCMHPAMQSKLLRVLENRLIERVGGEKSIPINVRIISATNIDFAKEIKEKRFRHDLYYRLNVIPVALPSLKERKEDIPLFIEYFLKKFNRILNKKVKGFESRAMPVLLNYNWPGNVRELSNLIERVVVLSKDEIITKEELPFQSDAPINQNGGLKELLEYHEREIIEKALEKNKSNITLTAKDLNIARTSLISRLKSLKVNPGPNHVQNGG
jgi:DNA-binding NtrC family response regulator